mmetsp:Transcript_14447/g.24256  ORF Transcript_14447/g.24256 Transcript_14447/m.24256 type:complete len:182 (+) Transcript_14447:29-574(+)
MERQAPLLNVLLLFFLVVQTQGFIFFAARHHPGGNLSARPSSSGKVLPSCRAMVMETTGGIEELTGREKRALRSLAGKRKMEGTMHSMNYSGGVNVDGEENRSFMDELCSSLAAHELVNVKMTNVNKKQLTKQAGLEMGKLSSSHLVQVIGHTAIFYKESFLLKRGRKICIENLLLSSPPS